MSIDVDCIIRAVLPVACLFALGPAVTGRICVDQFGYLPGGGGRRSR
jgi:hypothetical protein